VAERLEPVWIDDQQRFEALVGRLAAEPRYALDTEFHRERTYFPKLALLQLASPSELALVDPLAVDLGPLVELFHGGGLAVLHAAQQDLDVLHHSCRAIPARLYDTQLAAGFLGYGTPSLVSLLNGELRVNVAKGDRLTDWLHRPLTAEQRSYAASDVAHLLRLHDVLDRQLADMGRRDWASDACEELRLRPPSGTKPEDAWLRLKDARVLRPRGRGVAQAVAAWRERRAMGVDQPVRQILPDLAVLGIAQRIPTTPADLGRCRGVDERHTRGVVARDLLDAVQAGAANEVHLDAPDGDDLDRHLRPAVTLVSAWVSDLARRQRIDTTLLATRSDLISLIRGDRDARLSVGWRADLLGTGVRRLMDGHAALTFEPDGGLRLIDLPAP
jgi:ribonuclease D